MKSWQFAVLGLLCLPLPACRSGSNQAVSLLERELRDQEDEIYRLRNRLKRCQEEAAPSSSEGSASKSRERDDVGSKLLLDFSGAKRAEGMGKLLKPNKQTTETLESEAAPLWGSAPASPNDPSSESLPDTLQMPSDVPATENGLPNLDGPGEISPQENESNPSEPDPPAPTDQVDNRQVKRIVLNPQFSGGYDADGESGHEGIIVVVEPRDGQGRPIDAPADASVVIIDPAIADETGRVARWDLTASETARLFGRSGSTAGMQLALRWPAGPPIHPDVRLYVRYTTSDGRILQADMPMRIDLPQVARPEKDALGWIQAEPSPVVASDLPPPAGTSSAGTSPPRTAFRTRVPTLAIRPSAPPEASSETPKKPAVVAERPSWMPYRR